MIHRITPEAIEWVVKFLQNSPTDFEITPAKAWLMHCACAFGADPWEAAAAIDDGRIQSSMDAEKLAARFPAIRQANPNEQDERYRALAEMAAEAKKLGLE